jgi:hypothetical protein
MALDAAELARIAAHLDPDHPIRVDGATVAGRFETATFRLVLSDPRERVIGLFRFPIADVRVELEDADDALAGRFLARFHTVFRKGGG